MNDFNFPKEEYITEKKNKKHDLNFSGETIRMKDTTS